MSTQKSPSSEKNRPEAEKKSENERPPEFGGFEKKKEPTRYGDWEVDGRCTDF